MTSRGGLVIYVGPFDFPSRNAAAQLVDATAGALASEGHSVVIVGRSTDEGGIGSEFVLSDGVTVRLAARASRPASLGEVWRTIRTVAEIVQSDDASTIIVYNAPSLTLLLTMLLGRVRRTPVLAHCTEWYAAPPLRPQLLRSLAKRADISLRMRVLHRLVAGLIVSSDYLKQYYRDRETLVLPTLTPQIAHRSAVRVPNGPPRLVYAGIPFERGKSCVPPERMKDRLDLAVEWLAALKEDGINFCFDVFGISGAEYLAAVPRHAKLLERAGPSIVFHGHVPHGRVAAAVRDADFTLLVRDPSRTTMAGFPTKVTESVIAGTPPIASSVGDTAKYIEHEVTGFLLPIDREESARVLRRAVSMTARQREEMKSRAAEVQVLDPEKWGARISSFLSEFSGAGSR